MNFTKKVQEVIIVILTSIRMQTILIQMIHKKVMQTIMHKSDYKGQNIQT